MEVGKEFETLKKRKIPKSVAFILGNIFLERCCTVGRNAILVAYLNQKLNFDYDDSITILRLFEVLSHMFPLFGAIVGDCWWGHFNTVLYFSLLFAVGSLMLAVGAIDSYYLPATVFTFIGLTISVIGSGSMRANLAALGGDQFQLPEEKEHLATFFIFQIFSIKLGFFVGYFTNKFLLKRVKCFSNDDCFPLLFGIPTIAMTIAFCLMLLGRSSLTLKTPNGNNLMRIVKCVAKGISVKFRKPKNHWKDPKSHWLDNATDQDGDKIVNETKHIIRVLLLFSPLPAFWAVYQKGYRWVEQSARMNHDLGFVTIESDDLIALHPISGVLAVPICVYILFPLVAKIGITSCLHKMAVGGVLAVIASIAAGFLEIYIQKTYVNVLWLIPQYVLATFSENFIYNPHLFFSYSEAPEGMKAIMTSLVFACRAIGYAFAILLSETGVFPALSMEYFFLGWVLFVSMIAFVLLSLKHKSISDIITRSRKDKESEA